MQRFLLIVMCWTGLLASLGLSQSNSPVTNPPSAPVISPPSSKSAQTIRSRGRLILAIDPQFAPFALRDEKNRLVGFDVDLARAIAAALGVPLEVQSVGFNGLLSAIQSARADLAGSGLQAQKRSGILYSKVYFDNTQIFVVRAGNPSKFVFSANNLSGKQMGVRANTIGFLAAYQQLVPLGVKISVFDSNQKALEALQAGKIESLILDLPTFEAYKARGFAIERLAGTFVGEQYVFALSGASDLLPFLNNAIVAWQKNGGYQKALEKWLLDR